MIDSRHLKSPERAQCPRRHPRQSFSEMSSHSHGRDNALNRGNYARAAELKLEHASPSELVLFRFRAHNFSGSLKMPDSRGGKLLSMLPSRVYQPILNQPEDSHTCLACDKTASSRAAGLQFLAAAFGFVGLFLGWYALFGPRAGDCRHDFRREDHFIPSKQISA